MIKTILFDNNGVLTTSDSEETFPKLSKYLNLPIKKIKPVWDEVGKDLDIGKITSEEFLRKFLTKINYKGEYKKFFEVYLTNYSRKEEMYKFTQSLKEDFEIAMLTNFGDWFSLFNKKWKLNKLFDEKIFISYKIKLRKPDKKAYKYVLNKLNRKAEEVVFIDDNIDNIKSALSLGIKAIHFTNLENLKIKLDNITKNNRS